jgi:hypothetical protein
MSKMTELTARMPWVDRLVLPVDCEGFMSHTPLKAVYKMGNKPPIGRDKYRCKAKAYWRLKLRKSARDLCWQHLWSEMYAEPANQERLDRWVRAHVGNTIHLDMKAYNQSRRDLEICILAVGKVKGSREMMMPSGEMATDAFEDIFEEAWNRLTPGQQAAVMDGRFSLTVPTWHDAVTGEIVP